MRDWNEHPLHYSEIASFLRCRYAHRLTYIEKLRPREQNPRMQVGTFGHIALDALFRSDYPAPAVEAKRAALLEEGVTGTEETAALGLTCALRAYSWLGARGWKIHTPGDGSGVFSERTMKARYRDLVVEGTIDALLEDPSGDLFLDDHKFRSTLQDDTADDIDLQMAMYQYLLHQNGVEVRGVAKLQIRAVLPRVPKVTKSGAVSRQAIITTWDIYRQQVIAAGEDPADYEDMRVKLEHQEFERLTLSYRNMAEVERTMAEVVYPTALELKSDPSPIRCMSPFICRGCRHRELCIEDLKGGDTDLIRRTSYQTEDGVDPADWFESVTD